MRLSLFAPLEGLIAPAPLAQRVAFLKTQPFAHRGLHSAASSKGASKEDWRVENSRAAFRAAILLGHGIELDVQAASGGEAFVFHDAELERLTSARGAFRTKSAIELDAIKLAGTEEAIPRLEEILKLVGGRVPVLIEVKTKERHVAALCLSVRRALEGYRGAAAIMSFNPEVGHWFNTHAPRIVRGLVVTEEGEVTRKERLKGWFKRWASMARAKPDFLAYDVRDLPSRFAVSARSRGITVLTWTVRDAADEQAAFEHADEAIYEKIA
ncbi:glycerophosphodiester phosphodiesterase [Sphingomonas paeninsulae]|uniref:Glycerophosphodiester phosphodiesterase n=1 Tax=Sphingomonas paeninsulae TaxID=2319844 RepID=A0A494TAZ7_SPHPE|nr:glycerophosphodiester phosphodiesterase family protein [Sphingomonas paeninsulae]AYJ86240.1 glycerophosphodiester phosphodiesterase [Sphingomonas paeninsulae]